MNYKNRLDEQCLTRYTVRVCCDRAKARPPVIPQHLRPLIKEREREREQDITFYLNLFDFIIKSCTLKNKSSFSC